MGGSVSVSQATDVGVCGCIDRLRVDLQSTKVHCDATCPAWIFGPFGTRRWHWLTESGSARPVGRSQRCDLFEHTLNDVVFCRHDVRKGGAELVGDARGHPMRLLSRDIGHGRLQ